MALHAVYIINRLPTLVLHNLSPFEKLFGQPPGYSILKPFGCASFVLLQPHEHTKLEPYTYLCFFLGYGIERKGYRCWDPISNRLRISRHVTFWENTMFSSLSKFHQSVIINSQFFTDSFKELFPSLDAGDSDISPPPPAPVEPAPVVNSILVPTC